MIKKHSPDPEASFRGLIIGAIGSVIVTAASLYTALRLGALPWPTIFVAILSLAILKALGKTDLKEINVAHTTMSAGSMVAGGLAFTLPAIWIINPLAEFRFWSILLLVLGGVILGLAATSLFRRYFIDDHDKEYPFPVGVAAYQSLKAGSGGKYAGWLFSSLSIAVLITVLRDRLAKIPAILRIPFPKTRDPVFEFWVSPMAVGIGYIIGPLYTGVWALGAILAYGLITPLGLSFGWFSDLEAAEAFRSSLGIGLMVGTGLGVLVKGVLPRLKRLLKSSMSTSISKPKIIALLAAAYILVCLAGDFPQAGFLTPLVALLVVTGALFAAVMAAALTGQSGVNPMEILAILVLLAAKLVAPSHTGLLIGAATVTAVTAGLTGDIMNDYRVGSLLGTAGRAQRKAEALGAVLGALVSVFVFYAIIKVNGAASLGKAEGFPAPQAHAVAAMAGGIPDLTAFWAGLIVGATLLISGLPSLTLGLGVYLPAYLTIPIVSGGVIALIGRGIDRRRSGFRQIGVAVASGLLGGEAITGVILAMAALFGSGLFL